MPGKMNSTSGKMSLHGGLGGLFFGQLTAADAHRVALRAECLGDAGAEPVGLDQHGRQGAQVGHAGPRAQFVEHFGAGAAHLQLEIGQGELLGQDAVGPLHFVGHLAHRLVEAQARLDADHHQVQGVGQGQEDGLFAAAAEEADDQVGQVEEQTRPGRSTRPASFG